jgi:CBS domain-containing protein
MQPGGYFRERWGDRHEGHARGYIDITPADFKEVYRVAYALAKNRVLHSLTAPALAATADTPVSTISALFREKNINRLPVIGSDERPIGIVTRSDLVDSYCMLG